MYETLMTALTVLFLAAMGYGLACHVVEFWQKVRPRKAPAKAPAAPVAKPGPAFPSPGAPAPAPSPEYRLRLKLDGMKLEWTFPSPEARYWFNIGFREGAEYQIEALKRKRVVGPNAYVEFGPLKEVQS